MEDVVVARPVLEGARAAEGAFDGFVRAGRTVEMKAFTGVTGDAPGLNLVLYGVVLLVMLRFLPDGLIGLASGVMTVTVEQASPWRSSSALMPR